VLLSDEGSSVGVKVTSYSLLRRLTTEQAQALSSAIEAVGELDATESSAPKLSESLMEAITSSLPPLSDQSKVYGHLLSWMVLFDWLDGAGVKLKSAYVNCIKDANVIPAFMTTVINILRVGDGPKKWFDLAKWNFTAWNPLGAF
jgi:hypothetical protein